MYKRQRHDSDWHYSGDASLLGQRLGLAQGYVNNPRFEAWRSQAGDDLSLIHI